jgi:hypothetical protein
MRVLIAFLLCASVASASFQIIRNDLTDNELNGASDPECASIFLVTLEPQHTIQGNDIGITTPHGANVTVIDLSQTDDWKDWPGLTGTLGGDYTNEPFRSDAEKQALARAMFSVTALTESTATPVGFLSSTLRERSAVCVYVRNVGRRWVEVMAETKNSNQQICVQDWKPEDVSKGRANLDSNPFEEACAAGNLYACRTSGNPELSGSTFEDKLNLKFYCKDSCEDLIEDFRFRIVAAQKPAVPTSDPSVFMQPDSENWCLVRRTDDFPSSLLNAYPANYVPPVVFASLNLGASTMVVSALAILLSVLALLW